MTRGANVEYNLNVSPYKVTINNVTFYFSSKSHLNKFLETRSDEINRISESLTKRFKIKINTVNLALLYAYIKIETRGFLIEINNEKITDVTALRVASGKIKKDVTNYG